MEEQEKIEQTFKQLSIEYEIIKRKNKTKILIPSIIGFFCILLLIIGMLTMPNNMAISSILTTYPTIILIIDIITFGIMYISLKNKEVKIQTEINILKKQLKPNTEQENIINTNKNIRKNKKNIIIPVICFSLIIAIIIPIICILTIKKPEYITLQYKTVNTDNKQIEVKIEIDNKTQKNITFHTSDFTIKKDGLPVEANNFLIGYTGTISPFRKHICKNSRGKYRI